MQVIRYREKNILLLADTHGMHRDLALPEAMDLVIHAGDICNDGNLDQIKDFMAWYGDLPIPRKIFVSGNHDLVFELEPEEAFLFIPSSVTWLNDRVITKMNLKIGAASPSFYFGSSIPNDLDILISHQPPLGILDQGLGCPHLRSAVETSQPAIHIFGHVHESHGRTFQEKTHFINASSFHLLCPKENPSSATI